MPSKTVALERRELMKNEFEIINHGKMKDIYFFVADIHYRKPHLHSDMELFYVLKGEITIYVNQREIQLKAGQLIVFNPCQLHELCATNFATVLVLQMNNQMYESIFPLLAETEFISEGEMLPTVEKNNQLLYYILQAAQSFFEAQPNFELVVHAFSSMVLHELICRYPNQIISEGEKNRFLTRQERINRISNYIRENYQDKLSLAEIAQIESLSITYLSHFFRENFGLSFQEYVNNIRSERAKQLLSTTKKNLLEIAYLCGFSDVRYLNKSFKLLYGLSPKEFRGKLPDTQELFLFAKNASENANAERFFSCQQSLKMIQEYYTSQDFYRERKFDS